MGKKPIFIIFGGKKRSNWKKFKKRLLRASTRDHDPSWDNTKIWPTLIFLRCAPSNTFAMLPVHALINDPKKKVTSDNYDPWPFFWQHKIWPSFNICMTQFFSQLPVRVLINDPKKNRYVHQLGPMTYFLTTQNLTKFHWYGTQSLTHICKASCACPN